MDDFRLATNSTLCGAFFSPPQKVCWHSQSTPFYYVPSRDMFSSVSDPLMALIAPVIAYWGLSLFFHVLDMSNAKWLDKYRIHESVEVTSRNLASRSQVVWAVIFQHVLQTVSGVVVLDAGDESKRSPTPEQAMAGVAAVARWIEPVVDIVSKRFSREVRGELLTRLAYTGYWWAIPAVQLVFAMFIIDTWQYFLHRAMHSNKYLYKAFHSWHHRLYVPYAFGALYNHPLEGFVLDSAGALIAEHLSMMNARQAGFLFGFSTLKTVDDHCGYNFPWDPLQMMSGNNADYHDIHHQVIGIKSNFAQPFFVHWDYLLGTRLTRKDIEQRRKKASEKAQ